MVRLISFGYGHLGGQAPPAAERTEDVRTRLRDPAAARDILDLDGRDVRVQRVVLGTPGARELLVNLAAHVALPAGPKSIAVGCVGGKHRAAALIEILGGELRDRGIEVEIEHLHVDLPRLAAGAVKA